MVHFGLSHLSHRSKIRLSFQFLRWVWLPCYETVWLMKPSPQLFCSLKMIAQLHLLWLSQMVEIPLWWGLCDCWERWLLVDVPEEEIWDFSRSYTLWQPFLGQCGTFQHRFRIKVRSHLKLEYQSLCTFLSNFGSSLICTQNWKDQCRQLLQRRAQCFLLDS